MSSDQVLAILFVTYPDGREESVTVRQSPLGIGSSAPNQVLLPDPVVSRQHARLQFEGDRVHLVDLNSTNGTFIGPTRLAPHVPYVVAFGVVFRVGPYNLRLEQAAQPQQQAAAAPAAMLGATDFTPAAQLPPEPTYEQIFGLLTEDSRYLEYLPPIYREHPLLGRYLRGLEAVLLPIEQIVDNFDLYLDPVTTPESFLEELAAWLGLTLDEKWPPRKRRTLVEQAAILYQMRGTRWALGVHMEIYSGIRPEIIEPADQPHFFQVRLRVPPGQTVDRDTVERIIQANKPAHTTYALEIVTAA